MHEHDEDDFSNNAEACEAADDIPNNPDIERSIGAVIARRYSRRDMLKGSLGVTAATALFGAAALGAGRAAAQSPIASTTEAVFTELAAGIDDRHHIAEGYTADVLLRWGDPLFPGMAPFDPRTLTGEEQARRFGYNNDYVAFFPLGGTGDRGLLCVNHEYVNSEVMFPGLNIQQRGDFSRITKAHVEVEMAAHGVSIVEIVRDGGRWYPVVEGKFNRRLTASTPMTLDGPAAGHDRLKTAADPTGLKALGTFNNCAGGHTPWGTYLTTEENFHGYFWTDAKLPDGKPNLRGHGGSEAKSYDRYRIPSNWYSWGSHEPRFNIETKSIRAIRRRLRSSIPRLAASATKAPNVSSTAMAASSSIRVTTHASSTSIASSAATATDRTIVLTTCASCPRGRCRSPASMMTARSIGYRSFLVKVR